MMKHCPVPHLWPMLSARLGMEERQARQLWKQIADSQESAICAWRYHVWRLDDDVVRGCYDEERVTQFLRHTWAPQPFIAVLERLVEVGTLDRQAASVVEEAVLRWTSSAGDWKPQARHKSV